MVSSHLVDVFKGSSPFFKATYIVAYIEASEDPYLDASKIYSKALRFPICGRAVFEIICRLLKDYKSSPASSIQLPRRLFRPLFPMNGREWNDQDHPLPFLRDIYYTPNLPVNVDAHVGYALTKAVHAQFTPLVKFLLDNGASPNHREGIAILIAIRSKDLDMFKMLVERPQPRSANLKSRDKVSDSSMMGVALLSGASEIVKFYQEKGVVPDIAILRKMVTYQFVTCDLYFTLLVFRQELETWPGEVSCNLEEYTISAHIVSKGG